MLSNNLQIFIITMALLTGMAVGWFSCRHFFDIAEMCQIKYVSEEELIDLERSRIEKEIKNPEEKDLFYGDIDKAIELTTKLAASHNNRTTRVIFSISPVFAKGAESISMEIHQKVIEQLTSNVNKDNLSKNESNYGNK